MPSTDSRLRLLGGRLAVDFVNTTASHSELSWERLILFLESTSIVSTERGAQLVNLPQSDPQAAKALLLKARRLGSALRKVFTAMLRKQRSEEHTSELQSRGHLVCRLLLEKKKTKKLHNTIINNDNNRYESTL